MSKNSVKTVKIANDDAQPLHTKGQKSFNDLVKKIELRRERLITWESFQVEFHRKYATQLLPAREALRQAHIKMVYRLDEISLGEKLSKAERNRVSGLITGLASRRLREQDDARLEAVHDRHSDAPFRATEPDFTPEQFALIQEALAATIDEYNAGIDAEEEAERRAEEARHAKAQHADRRKAAKEAAAKAKRDARQQAEDAKLSMSVREIYRKLASALHPDREQDPDERVRKTTLMQRVNDAYRKGNLLQLLELQLEIEHIDQRAINTFSEDTLKRYNKILREQVQELDDALYRIEFEFASGFALDPEFAVTPRSMGRLLDEEIARMQSGLKAVNLDLKMFDDIRYFKDWIKAVSRY
ncbi:J domain-containing protein [Paraburkholderia sp.]|uniref:J domain-containing protein n=1 Tax=Paraburkholderia sp. TaxID=1926495 RepID=UPI0023978803|nr:J domain-containing protein [Paraburkholderia sp.]MDE1182944.1 J domain-containing protein [Paraburkholderia sp.]